MRNLCLIVTFAAACLASKAAGELYDFNQKTVVVESWAGAGDNEALCVIDFGQDSFAFGYRWDEGDTFTRSSSGFADFYGYTAGANLSEAMLLALDEQTGLSVSYHYNNALGMALDAFEYDGQVIESDGWVTTYLSFYISGHPAFDEPVWEEVPPGSNNWVQTDTINHDAMDADGENWIFSQWGASGRVLQDGYYDGWTEGDAQTWTSSAPDVPTPEPCTLALVALGAAGVIIRRRRTA